MRIYDAAAKSLTGEAYRTDAQANTIWFYQNIDGEMVVVSCQDKASQKGRRYVEFEERDLDEALHFEDWLPADAKLPDPVD